MPIKIWKNGAIIIYKAARYIVPAVIATSGVVIGYLVGKRHKKETGGKGEKGADLATSKGK